MVAGGLGKTSAREQCETLTGPASVNNNGLEKKKINFKTQKKTALLLYPESQGGDIRDPAKVSPKLQL